MIECSGKTIEDRGHRMATPKSGCGAAKQPTLRKINVLQTGVIHWQFQEALGLIGDDLGIRPLFHEMILAAFRVLRDDIL